MRGSATDAIGSSSKVRVKDYISIGIAVLFFALAVALMLTSPTNSLPSTPVVTYDHQMPECDTC